MFIPLFICEEMFPIVVVMAGAQAAMSVLEKDFCLPY